MNVTKLKVPISLFGAALYFVGLISIIPLVVMAGYVMLFEEDNWLKRAAVKSVCVVLFFTVISAFLSLVGNSQSLLTDFVHLFNGTIDLSVLTRLLSICRTALGFIQTLVLLILGFSAMKRGDVRMGAIDKVVDRLD